MRPSGRFGSSHPDPMTVMVVVVLTALSLTMVAQAEAGDLAAAATTINRPPACSDLIYRVDTRIDGRTARRLRVRQPCRSRLQGLQAILSLWAVAGR